MSGRTFISIHIVLLDATATVGGTFDFPDTGDTSLQFHHWAVVLAI